MTSRVLPPEEWHRLVGTEVETIVPGLDPEQTRVLVVEDAGEIVGTWVVLRMVHIECIWVAPAHRGKASVLARLLVGMWDLARGWGAKAVLTGSVSEDVTAMIQRMGGLKLPGEHFAIPVRGSSCQP